MRESCSCGAAIHAISYARIKDWRQQHRCNPMTLLQALDAATEEAFDRFIFIDDEEENE
jgi:hypothetical protein